MRVSLGYQVLIAVITAICVGLFLGPLTIVFKPIGTIYVMLLQMVVLPYICLSIIHGLASLSPSSSKQLFKKGGPFYLILWGIVFFVIFLFMTLIPSASAIFNPEVPAVSLKAKLTANLLSYLIPSNPIYAFVNNIVPSIAVFGVIVGIAIMYLEKKEPLLGLVERGNRIIEKILDLLALISPIGVFTHIAIVVGTVQFSELMKINLYLTEFIIMTCLLTFWILPLILSSCTPMSFKEASKAIRAVSLLPFMTGISTIAIPFINKYLRKMGEKHQLPSIQNYRSISQTVVPLSYSFAQIGNALLLFFILFASFYYRHPFTEGEKSLLSFLTVPLSIGSSTTSINSVSFLFTELQFPENAMELYTATMPITINFQALLSVAGILTFILLVLFANDQRLQIKIKKLVLHLMGSLVALTLIVLAIRPFIHFEDNFHNLFLSRKISEAVQNPVSAQVYVPGETFPTPRPKELGKVLARILLSGVLRVGYDTYDIPYAYLNRDHELVGFDIAMAYQLARDINCRLEFIPVDYSKVGEELDQGIYDIAMCSIIMTEDRIRQMSFSNSYSEQNNVLLVPISKKDEFVDFEKVQKNKNLVISGSGAYKNLVSQFFPNAKRVDDFNIFQTGIDAWMWNQISATVWCMIYPNFTVIDYEGDLGKGYLGYPVRPDAVHLLEFINSWMKLKVANGFYQEQTDYWILGKNPKNINKPRWSIIRNVLHWVD